MRPIIFLYNRPSELTAYSKILRRPDDCQSASCQQRALDLVDQVQIDDQLVDDVQTDDRLVELAKRKLLSGLKDAVKDAAKHCERPAEQKALPWTDDIRALGESLWNYAAQRAKKSASSAFVSRLYSAACRIYTGDIERDKGKRQLQRRHDTGTEILLWTVNHLYKRVGSIALVLFLAAAGKSKPYCFDLHQLKVIIAKRYQFGDIKRLNKDRRFEIAHQLADAIQEHELTQILTSTIQKNILLLIPHPAVFLSHHQPKEQ